MPINPQQELIITAFTICSLFFILIIISKTYRRIGLIHLLIILYLDYAVVRPYGLILNDGSYIYSSSFSWGNYIVAYALNFVFFSSLCIVLLTFDRRINRKVIINPNVAHIAYPDIFSIIICVASIFLLYSVSGNAMLSINREGSLGAVSPYARIIYPFAMVTGAVLIARGIVISLYFNRYFFGLVMISVGLLSVIAIGQRGVSVVFAFIASAFCWNGGKKFNSLLGVLIVVFIAIFSRLIIPYIFGIEIEVLPNNFNDIISNYLLNKVRSPDGDGLEVFAMAIKYVNEEGVLYGAGIFNNIFNIMTSDFRLNGGFLNSLDVLNSYFDSHTYWNLKFGFNVNTTQELYLNFGVFSVFLAPLVFYPFAIANRFYNREIDSGKDPIFYFIPLYALFNITSSLSGVVWTVLLLILYFFIYKRSIPSLKSGLNLKTF